MKQVNTQQLIGTGTLPTVCKNIIKNLDTYSFLSITQVIEFPGTMVITPNYKWDPCNMKQLEAQFQFHYIGY